MFKQGEYYMHTAMRDVCIRVIKVSFASAHYTKMKVEYINLGYMGEPMIIMPVNSYKIEAKDYCRWVHIPEEDLHKVRTEAGVPR